MSRDPQRAESEHPVVRIDLTGSTTHEPEFLSVDVTGDWPADWDDAILAAQAARWAGVPVEQVEVIR